MWHFGFNNGQPSLGAEVNGLPTEPLPPRWAGRDWRNLYQRRLNLAWLPPDQVFLRVVQLPAGEPSELPAMVELQLEKLSPLPVAQIVWSYETVPSPAADLQTVVVVIVARSLVEEFLGRLESQGYVPDRLEFPLLHQLLATPNDGDGLWIYPSESDGKRLCLVAWWTEGTLQNLNLLHVSTGPNWGKVLAEQLTQLTWSGEMEGWLTQTPGCRLVASPEVAATWEPVLKEWAGHAVEVKPSLAPAELAALNARRVAYEETRANLLPAEYTSRYRQQFVDRLWMGGLLAVGALYVLGVIIYFAAVQVVNFQRHRVDGQIVALTPTFTNANRLQERVQVLQDQVNLRYAGLECWKAACILLPSELTLTDYSFRQGKTLLLRGTVPSEQVTNVISYYKAMMTYRPEGSNGPSFFSHVGDPTTRRGFGVGQNQFDWDFTCELRQAEGQ